MEIHCSIYINLCIVAHFGLNIIFILVLTHQTRLVSLHRHMQTKLSMAEPAQDRHFIHRSVKNIWILELLQFILVFNFTNTRLNVLLSIKCLGFLRQCCQQ